MPTTPRYDRTTILLHWTTAALVLLLWVIGQTADWLPRGPVRLDYWSVHILLGFTLAAVLVWRIVWRGSAGRGLPSADQGALQVIAKATHYALYALLLAVVSLGIANAFVRGFSIFGLFNLTQIGDPDLKGSINHWHEWAANAVLLLAVFHAAAALFHHYVWRDGLLSRMGPSATTPEGRTRL